MFQNYIQYMFVFYNHRKFLISHLTAIINLSVYFQIYQVYMYTIMLLKMKFMEATTEKKIRCFKSNICILINTFL